jgi:hypothetical protein
MKKALFAVIALALVTPVLADIGEQPPEAPPGVEAAHNQVVRFLELTEDQVLAWDELWLIHRDAEQPLRDAIRDVEAQIQALLDSPDPDPAELGELVLQRHDLGQALRDVHVIYHDGFVALLDQDQVDRLYFLARADDVQRFIPAFKLFELIPRR